MEQAEGDAADSAEARQTAELVVAQAMQGLASRIILIVGVSLTLECIVFLVAMEGFQGRHASANRAVTIGVSALVLALISWGVVDWLLTRARMNAARLLLARDHPDSAILLLKRLARRPGAVGDEALYMIALAYDRQGKTRLSEEGYRVYLKTFEESGSWVMEARVRMEEIAQAATRPPPVVQAQATPAKPDLLCPFCKDTFGEEALTAECADCATPHHLKCYEEQGGCALYGCRSSTVKARVRD